MTTTTAATVATAASVVSAPASPVTQAAAKTGSCKTPESDGFQQVLDQAGGDAAEKKSKSAPVQAACLMMLLGAALPIAQAAPVGPSTGESGASAGQSVGAAVGDSAAGGAAAVPAGLSGPIPIAAIPSAAEVSEQPALPAGAPARAAVGDFPAGGQPSAVTAASFGGAPAAASPARVSVQAEQTSGAAPAVDTASAGWRSAPAVRVIEASGAAVPAVQAPAAIPSAPASAAVPASSAAPAVPAAFAASGGTGAGAGQSEGGASSETGAKQTAPAAESVSGKKTQEIPAAAGQSGRAKADDVKADGAKAADAAWGSTGVSAFSAVISGGNTAAKAGAPAAPAAAKAEISGAASQIARAAAQAQSEGRSQIRIHLSPEELGGINVRLVARDGGMTVQIAADRHDTGTLLASGLHELRSAMGDQGISLSRAEVLLTGSGGYSSQYSGSGGRQETPAQQQAASAWLPAMQPQQAPQPEENEEGSVLSIRA